jgi:hypothetical protein
MRRVAFLPTMHPSAVQQLNSRVGTTQTRPITCLNQLEYDETYLQYDDANERWIVYRYASEQHPTKLRGFCKDITSAVFKARQYLKWYLTQ